MDELVFDQKITRQLADGASHAYGLTLEEGQYLEAVAQQQGVDVAVELVAPDEAKILVVDSPIGRDGPERLIAVARVSGEYRLVVRSTEEAAPSGNYELVVQEPRVAISEEKVRADAELLFSQAEGLRRLGKKESNHQALDLYSQALEILRAANLEVRQADIHHRLGWVSLGIGETGASKAYFSDAVELYRKMNNRFGEAVALNFLGAALHRLGFSDEALGKFQQSLALSRDLGAPSLTMGTLNNMGVFHRRRGETEKALSVLREARTLAKALRDTYEESVILGNLGTLLLSHGKLKDAADRLEEAQAIVVAQGDLQGQAVIWNRLGDVRRRQGRREDALKCFENALDIRHQTGDRRGEATTRNSIGIIQSQLKEYQASQKAYENALEIYRELGDPRGEAHTLFNLGRLHAELNDPAQALSHHRQVAPFLQRLGDRHVEVSNQYGMARALRDLGDLEASHAQLEEILDNVEELREATGREALRISFFATKQQYYDLAIDVNVKLHAKNAKGDRYLKEAFALSERRRARALLDLLGEDAAKIRQDAPSELLAEEQDIQSSLNKLELERRSLDRKQGHDGGALAEVNKNLRLSRADLDSVRARLRAASPRLALTRPHPVKLDDVRTHLVHPNSQLLIYTLGEDNSYLWLITFGQPVESHILPARPEIEKQATKALELLTSHNSRAEKERPEHLQRLAQTLLGPVAKSLRARRLVIVAEGALLHLPFAALPKPSAHLDPNAAPAAPSPVGNELIRHHELVYLPSTSVLLTLRDQTASRAPAEKQLAIFAAPVFAPPAGFVPPDIVIPIEPAEHEILNQSIVDLEVEGPPPLPGTLDEGEAIRSVARGETQTFFGYDASKQNVINGRLGDFQILHFATHGLFNPEHPELSGVILSLFDRQNRPVDGFLRLHEIYNLQLPSELVVLSACSTGLGEPARGEGLVGLTRGFMYAGIPRVIASLWNISDSGTAELMKYFYWSLLEMGAPPSVALRAAQIAMLDHDESRYSHPSFWAGFLFQGDWRLSNDSPSTRDSSSAQPDGPIERLATGSMWDDEEDADYPDPDDPWCDDLPERWQRKICKVLQDIQTTKG